MAYSENPITVQRMLPYLRPLIEGRETVWRTAPNRSRWLAYRIREALHVASLHPNEFPELATVRYRIEVVSSREVRAKVKDLPLIEIESEEPRAPARVFTEGVIGSIEQIVQEWQREGHTAGKLYFPDTELDPAELQALWSWAQEAGVLIFENMGAITLLPMEGNEDSAPFAFDPADLHND